MALIGPMKYLTIGGSTYEIQGQEITSSAITSALGYTPYNGSTNPNGYISSFTDEKLKTTAVTNGTTYYPIVGSNSTTAANKNYDSTGFSYAGTNGTANGTNGNALLTLGNNTASTSANWKKGTLRLYGTSTSYTDIVSAVTTTARTITLPNATGTVALTSDIPTVPTITLNGSSTTSPSFYAPTGAGTSGQYLKSNGSGAPSWTNFPTIPSITLNGSSNTSPSFYAPTSVGTSGYYLKSNGSGAPSWTAFPTIPSAGSSASAVGTSASGGSATTWSRSDHVHNITSTIIGSAGGVTEVKINGTTYTPTSGTVDLGTVSSTAAQIIRW